jgi:RNA methyltransferase, TrmH family
MITSKHNEKIKMFASLKQKKYRDEYNMFICEGFKLIYEAFSSGYTLVSAFALKNRLSKIDFIKNVEIVSPDVLSMLCESKTPQGEVAIFKKKENSSLKSPNGYFVVLENIQDPNNLGAIMRSALGAGFNDVYLINSTDCYDIKSLRSSMGAFFHLNCQKCTLNDIKNLSYDKLLCADLNGKDLFNLNLDKKLKIGIAVGNEGNGVSDELISVCNEKITIPMQKPLESLNASVSAGIIMYTIKYGK